MATEVEKRWRASDGRTFATEEEADCHERLTEARRDWEQASRVYSRAIAETQRTADDKLFTFEKPWPRRYWRIVPSWANAGLPTVCEVDFQWHDVSADESEAVTIQTTDPSGNRRAYRIDELYYDHREAQKALLVAMEEYVAEMQAELERERGRTE